jgi:hypothetical protein
MAEVTDRDRGQLLLVAGIVLAVLFVALALLVNAAIYTDNVATRGGDSAGEALTYQAGVTDAVGGLIEAENANPSHSSRGEIRDSIQRGAETIDDTNGRNYLRRGAATGIETDSITAENTTDGVLIRQHDTGEVGNWSVNATDVRAFDIAIDSGETSRLNLSRDDPFEIEFGTAALFVYIDEDEPDELVVARDSVENEVCTADVSADGTVGFEVTENRLDGDPCRFEWPDVDEVTFRNGHTVNGTYNMTVDSDETAGFPAGVEATEAIYSVDLDLHVATPTLRYETTVTVAPGEPDA